ncbi:efflux RND transporter periplasmic adaptor subunit [Kitasatospora cineracea]|uniref:Macrolide-specific efflux system membrane fusion protein n=1 Tax=Kitasatospora cineracea TaxID=88074 RepID=A0A3N4RRI4_9ACTN|nr:biotin/lipoyl-binding protein [Kitasatospora cineracea]RPE33501.1 macrolide-specific efflux system membrane fusion protein [Kitasatospora cineracea]
MKVLPRRRGAVLVNSALGVALLGGAALAYTTLDSGTSKAATSSKVRTATVAKGTVQATVSGSGTLFSPSDAAQDFTTGGRLTAVKVAVGDAVKKGQVLATVDTAATQQQVDQAQAALNTAEANLTKAEAGETVTTTVPGTAGSGSSNSGRSGGSGSSSGAGAQSTPQPTTTTTVKVDQAQVASAQQQVDNAEATLANAKDALAGTTLTATTDGTVASVTGKVGETVSGTGSAGSSSSGGSSSGSSGTKTATGSGSSSSTPTGFIVLTNPAGMEVTANFSELDSLKLKKGQSATVTLNAQSDTRLDATVLSVSSLPSSSTNGAVQYGATLQIGGDTSALRTGLSATISVTTGSAENALSVPTSALQGTGSTRTATVVHDDGSTERVQVAVGIEGDSTVQVTDGLTEGEKVELTSTTAGTGNGFPSGQFPGLNGGAGGFGGGTGGFGGGTGGSRSGGGAGGTR